VLHNGVNSKFSVRFRRWTRSAHAVFASLGKAISIGKLKIEMAGQTLFRGFENISLIFTADFDEESEVEFLGHALPADALVAAEMIVISASKEIEEGIVTYYNINQTVKTA